MPYFKRVSRAYCATCHKKIVESQYGTWINSLNDEDIVSFCCQPCAEYFFVSMSKKDLEMDVLRGMVSIEDKISDFFFSEDNKN